MDKTLWSSDDLAKEMYEVNAAAMMKDGLEKIRRRWIASLVVTAVITALLISVCILLIS